MRISEILKIKRTLSFELFPPKGGEIEREKLLRTIDELKELRPDFISVTHGAGGSNSRGTAEVAKYIKSAQIEPLAHVTGGPFSPAEVDGVCADFLNCGVENVLALRGDKPVDFGAEYCKHFPHATDLEAYIKKYNFCMGAACYPEGHIESETLYADLDNLKKKEDCGAEFFITQVFYDNSYYYRLINEAVRRGVKSPIIPGIMPLTSPKNVNRIKSMCGSSLPLEFRNMIEVYSNNPAALREVGINYAVYQIIDLIAKGAPGVHVYIMNRAQTAKDICLRLENVINELFAPHAKRI